jgi:hypothetical protein
MDALGKVKNVFGTYPFKTLNGVCIVGSGDINPNGSGVRFPTATKTANYTVVVSDFYLRLDCTAGNMNVTLPALPIETALILKRINAGSNTISLIGTVDGSTSVTMTTQNQSVTLISNGTSWDIV